MRHRQNRYYNSTFDPSTIVFIQFYILSQFHSYSWRLEVLGLVTSSTKKPDNMCICLKQMLMCMCQPHALSNNHLTINQKVFNLLSMIYYGTTNIIYYKIKEFCKQVVHCIQRTKMSEIFFHFQEPYLDLNSWKKIFFIS